MANIKSAIKRARQNDKRRAHNASLRSKLRTFVKNVIKSCTSGDKDKANQAYKLAQPVIDSMVNKGIIHKNKAARTKSSLNKRVKSLSA